MRYTVAGNSQENLMDELIRNAPRIIEEAARSPLGIFALMILALGILGFFFFREASERTRVTIYVLLIIGVASFGVATFRSMPGGPEPDVSALRPPQPTEGPPSTGTRPSALVQVQSDPESADTYLDWKPKGRTPVSLEGTEIGGLLVVVKEGYRAGFRQIRSTERGQVKLILLPESKPSRRRLLLMMSEGGSGEAFFSLRGRLVEEGFTVLGPEEAREFQRELRNAGGLSHHGFRAWARAKFDSDVLLMARLRRTSRELTEQEFGHAGVREAVKGAVRSEVGIELEVIDLRSGDHLAAVSASGIGIALDRTQSLQKALMQAATESAKLLRERIKG